MTNPANDGNALEVIQKVMSITASEGAWLIKWIKDIQATNAMLNDARKANLQIIEEQREKLQMWFDCGAKIMQEIDPKHREDLPLSDGDVIDYIRGLQHDYCDILTVANRNGAIVNDIIYRGELPRALELLGKARNWVQDPVLRAEIQAVVPPTPRTAEDG